MLQKFCKETGRPGPCADPNSKRQQRLKKLAAGKADAKTSVVATKSKGSVAGLALSKHLGDRIATGDASYPDLVRHVQGLSTKPQAELTAIAQGLGSKSPIKTKDDALTAIHEAIRARKTSRSKIFSELRARKVAFAETPKLATVDGVEIFAVGKHPTKNGPRDYTREDLDKIARTFNELGATGTKQLQPTIVLGHEETDDPLKFWQNFSTGTPAVGTVSKVWRDGDKLIANFADVPKEVADAINQRAYRKCSIELYDDFEDQGQHHGLALRRVALLGGEIPQVKNLADLPKATFSESTSQIVHTFAESCCPNCEDGKPCEGSKSPNLFDDEEPLMEGMSKEEMIAALTDLGFDPAVLGTFTDEQLADTIRVLQEVAAEMPGEEEPAPEEPMPEEEAPAEEQMSEIPAAPHAPANQQPKKVTMQFSEKDVEAIVQRKIDAEREKLKRQAGIQAFCERVSKEGKIPPAWFDGTDSKPTLADALYAFAENPSGVTKFSEGSRRLTPMEVLMQVIDNGPNLVRFSEMLADPKQGPAMSDERKQKLLMATPLGKIAAKRQKAA